MSGRKSLSEVVQIAPTKPSGEEGSSQHSLVKQKMFIEEDEVLVAVARERLLAPQRVKICLDHLDYSTAKLDDA
jgi:hypothetical protein